MKEGYIRNLNQVVSSILTDLKLKPLKPLDYFVKNHKRFYTTPCRTVYGEIVVLKLIITNSKKWKHALKKEVKFIKFLEKTNISPQLKYPKILQSNLRKFPFWFTHKFLEGPLLGKHFRLFKISKQKQVPVQISHLLLALQKIPLKNISFPLDKQAWQYYASLLKDFFHQCENPPVCFLQAYNFLKKRKKYFNKYFVVAHGDFTLANFFFHNNEVYLTDWEFVHIDNMAADIARLWIQTWRYPYWRREIVNVFLKNLSPSLKKHFKEIFRNMVIIEAIKEFVCNQKKGNKKDLKLENSMIITVQTSMKKFIY